MRFAAGLIFCNARELEPGRMDGRTFVARCAHALMFDKRILGLGCACLLGWDVCLRQNIKTSLTNRRFLDPPLDP
jgi:hypothetical protein